MEGEPRVLPDLVDRDSLQGVHEEHLGDEVSSALGEMAGEVVNAALGS